MLKKFIKIAKMLISQTGKNWVSKTAKNAIFVNFWRPAHRRREPNFALTIYSEKVRKNYTKCNHAKKFPKLVKIAVSRTQFLAVSKIAKIAIFMNFLGRFEK